MDEVQKFLKDFDKTENQVNDIVGGKYEDNEEGRPSKVQRPEWEAWGIDSKQHFNEQEAINNEMEKRMTRALDS